MVLLSLPSRVEVYEEIVDSDYTYELFFDGHLLGYMAAEVNEGTGEVILHEIYPYVERDDIKGKGLHLGPLLHAGLLENLVNLGLDDLRVYFPGLSEQASRHFVRIGQEEGMSVRDSFDSVLEYIERHGLNDYSHSLLIESVLYQERVA